MNGTYQQQYLKEIGITVWSERELVSIEATPTDIKHVTEEKIYVKSKAEPHIENVKHSIHGPIISGVLDKDSRCLSLSSKCSSSSINSNCCLRASSSEGQAEICMAYLV